MIKRTLEFLVWLSLLVATAVLLQNAGTGTLALPHFTQLAWSNWLHTTEPATVVFAIIRVVALVATVYLFATSVLLWFAQALHVRFLFRAISFVSAPAVRTMVQRTVGLSLVATFAAPSLAFAAPAVAVDAPVLIHLQPSESVPTPIVTAAATPASTTTTTSTTLLAAAPAPLIVPVIAPEAKPPAVAANPNVHVVVAGDNLWTIAKGALTKSLSRPPTDNELADYWDQVVSLNQARLLEHKNPDLIFPGQTIELP